MRDFKVGDYVLDTNTKMILLITSITGAEIECHIEHNGILSEYSYGYKNTENLVKTGKNNTNFKLPLVVMLPIAELDKFWNYCDIHKVSANDIILSAINNLIK